MKSTFKLGRYKIKVQREKAAGPVGFVAYVDWKDGDNGFSAHVRNPDGPLGRFDTVDAAVAAATLRCEQVNAGEPFQTVLAEFCDGPFYGGWHIYLREKTDGTRNAYGEWGWERRAGEEGCRVHALVHEMGFTPPPEKRYGDDFEEWFAETFPFGIRVIVGKYRKLMPLPAEDQHAKFQPAPTAGVAT